MTLEKTLSSMLGAGVLALKTLIGKELSISASHLEKTSSETLLAGISEPFAVIRGEIEGDEDGEYVRFMLTAADATTLAGLMMMTPEDMIAERRNKKTLEGEELETLSEIANVLCSSFDSSRRESEPQAAVLRAKDHGLVHPESDEDGRLGSGELIGVSLKLTIEGFPAGSAWLLLPPALAERWNGGPITETSQDESGETMPIKGKLAAYLADSEVADRLRQSCRRIGLEIDRRADAEVPNPGEHKDGIVLLDVPPGDSRRFDWCKRLKGYHEEVRVALLIHHPSRSRVLQGFLAKADAIMGWPITEQQLAEKLSALLEPATAEPAS